MAGSIYRERSLRDPQHDGQRGGVAALQGERRLGRRNLSLRWIFRPSAGLLAGFSIHPDGKRALTSISKGPIGSGCWSPRVTLNPDDCEAIRRECSAVVWAA